MIVAQQLALFCALSLCKFEDCKERAWIACSVKRNIRGYAACSHLFVGTTRIERCHLAHLARSHESGLRPHAANAAADIAMWARSDQLGGCSCAKIVARGPETAPATTITVSRWNMYPICAIPLNLCALDAHSFRSTFRTMEHPGSTCYRESSGNQSTTVAIIAIVSPISVRK